MVWPFRKKRIEPAEIIISRIPDIDSNLQISFMRIKSDMQVIKEWINLFNTKEADQEFKLKEIERKLEGIDDIVGYLESSHHQFKEDILGEIDKLRQEIHNRSIEAPNQEKPTINPENKEFKPIEILEILTETQKIIFLRLITLLKESGQKWVSIKTLAQDLYPNKEYSQVRSTVSEYLDILMDNGLAKKQRKGKQTFISLTNKAYSIYKEQKSKEPVIYKEIKKKSKEVS